jgi:hypothetical protein
MQRLKIALPDELRARLDAASAKSGQSVAEEIRSRVEASFAREVGDAATRDFVEGAALMAAEIEREFGAAWHKHAGAHEMFTLTILARLKALKPQGSSEFGARPHATLPLPTVLGGDPAQLASIIENRLRQQPDFTTSAARRLMEDEYQRAELYRLGMAQAMKKGKPAPTILGGAEKKRGK